MDPSKEFFACLALRYCPSIGPVTSRKILDAYDSVYEAYTNACNWPARKVASKGQMDKLLSEVWRADAEVEYKTARQRGFDPITFYDSRYPQRLREISDAPLLLYYLGDASLLASPGVAIVGARKSTEYGLMAARRIGGELSRMGMTVISGMALGIDRQAHLGGLSGVGSSIGVLGCGLDVPYPRGNDDLRARLLAHGCLVSEYAPGTKPDSKHFPYRNRIISGLSMGVVVAEAAEKSGSLITARLAGEQGREVFALPGRSGDETFQGCHRLIKEGAALVETGEDVLKELRYQFGPQLDGLPTGKSADAPDMPDNEASSSSRFKPLSKPVARKGSVTASQAASFEKTMGEEISAVAVLDVSKADDLEGDERALWDILVGVEQMQVDEITRALSWAPGKASTVLLQMEMNGFVRQLPGMRFAVC